uniref:Putative ovule protein n=1 Tax=Solanum chacoense TaxID=4108 RepID=A0A0V0GQI0_SOLCH
MSLFPIPQSVLDILERIRRDFMWEGNRSSHKFHPVEWGKVIMHKSKGGPGIRDLPLHNKALLMK